MAARNEHAKEMNWGHGVQRNSDGKEEKLPEIILQCASPEVVPEPVARRHVFFRMEQGR